MIRPAAGQFHAFGWSVLFSAGGLHRKMQTTGRQQPYVFSGYVQAGLESEKGSALPVPLDLTKKRLAMQRLRREENLVVCLKRICSGDGGRHRTRTCDPCGVIAVLYQLS